MSLADLSDIIGGFLGYQPNRTSELIRFFFSQTQPGIFHFTVFMDQEGFLVFNSPSSLYGKFQDTVNTQKIKANIN